MGPALALDDARLILPWFQIHGSQSLSMVTVHLLQLSPAQAPGLSLQVFASLLKQLPHL